MRIALLTDGITPFVIGGMQRHSYYLAKYFARNGVQVDLYHYNDSAHDISLLNEFSDEEKKMIQSIVLEFPRMGNLPGHYIRESYEYSRRIFDRLKQLPPVDFIYAKGFTAWKLLEAKDKGVRLPPIGVNFHGYEMFQRAPSLRAKMEHMFLLRAPVKFNISKPDYVFSYGGRITELILKLGVPKERIIEAPAGIEQDWIIEMPRQADVVRKFIFVGRYERRKGIEELNQVLRSFTQPGKFEFYFVGDIPSANRIVRPDIHYLGAINRKEELKHILRKCDVLICPSHSEGMPNVILEGMASGLAVIATDVGAVNRLVSPENGWLIIPGHVNQLRLAFLSAMETSAERLFNMKCSSFRTVQQLTLDTTFGNLIKELKAISGS